ncbi:tetratricopeptide repeat protein [Marinobacter persicus]|uniref:TPR repeat protein n=1 Tax=Marinobacter persicus TaxID=930118 RepID=A0A2S6G1Q8_9GAMM|nr:tetratricopeptide repeat protein [Marinobacter persicus]PPK49086.1 TPR repeat protein [Marinobacter persicus]PPK50601.1 TPR repeat protein [Marinobacter persicus]PPK54934.1 TPR repeat protein [Marinobacter persicus]
MIRWFLGVSLLVLCPLLSAELAFKGEKVVEIFYEQDFEANLAKAKSGDMKAQYLVGAAYLYGLEDEDVEVDEKMGRFWLQKSADQGAAEAYSELARIYRYGIGVERDASKWEKYLIEAAERGMLSRQTDLMKLYRDGSPEMGVEKNEQKYIYWLKKEAEAGAPISIYNLAWSYREGRGIEQDIDKAFEWIMKGVQKDDGSAQAYAAEFFEEGLGTEKDLVKAYMLYDLSTGIGREAKSELAKKMNDDQIVSGQLK